MEAAAKAEQTASPVGSRNEFSKQLDGFVGCVERFAAQKFAHPTQEEYNVDPNSRTFSATLAGQGPADGAQYPEHLRHSSDTRHSDAADVRQTNPKPSPAESGGLVVSFSRGRYEARCMEAEQPGAPRASLKARSSSSHDRSGRRKEDGGVRQTVRGPREEQHSQNTTRDRGEPCRSQDRSHRTETDAEGDCGKPARRIAKLWRLVSNEADLHDRVSVSSRRARIRVRLEDGGRIKDLVRDLRSVLRQLQAEHPHGFTPEGAGGRQRVLFLLANLTLLFGSRRSPAHQGLSELLLADHALNTLLIHLLLSHLLALPNPDLHSLPQGVAGDAAHIKEDSAHA